jgi:hypothetical protein
LQYRDEDGNLIVLQNDDNMEIVFTSGRGCAERDAVVLQKKSKFLFLKYTDCDVGFRNILE